MRVGGGVMLLLGWRGEMKVLRLLGEGVLGAPGSYFFGFGVPLFFL